MTLFASPGHQLECNGPFHFISVRGSWYKIPGLPRRNRIPWSKSPNSSFPVLELVLGEIIQAIWIENHTSIHHNLIDADNSRPKGYFSWLFFQETDGLFANFPRLHWVFKILHLSPCMVIFRNNPMLIGCKAWSQHGTYNRFSQYLHGDRIIHWTAFFTCNAIFIFSVPVNICNFALKPL